MKKCITVLLCAVLAVSLCLFAASCSEPETIKGEGDTTVIQNPKGKPSDYSDRENAYIVAGRLLSLNSYRSDVSGTVLAEKSIIKYEQKVANLIIKKADESFSQAVSTSSLVNMGHQVFFKGGKAVVRKASDPKNGEWNTELQVATRSGYFDKYGNDPMGLSNYILNDDTIVFQEKVSEADGVYTYRYGVDPVKATSKYKMQMREFGGLSDYPEFSSCKLTVSFDKKWNPITVKTEDEYTISFPVIGKMNCKSSLTQTYSGFNEEVEIPDTALFNKAIDSTPSELPPLVPPVGEENLGELTDALLQLNLKDGVRLRGSLGAEIFGSKTALPFDATISFDMDKLTSSGLASAFGAVLDTELLGVKLGVYYKGDGFIYVKVGENAKYKYAIEGASEGISFEGLLSAVSVEKKSDNSYLLTLKSGALESINAALSQAFAGLGGGSSLQFTSLGANISVHGGRISSAELFGAFGDMGNVFAEASASETVIAYPDDLASYEQKDASVLADNFKAFAKLGSGLVNQPWFEGADIQLLVGSKSTINGGLQLPVLTKIRINLLPLLTGDYANALHLSGYMMGMKFYYNGDGNFYILQTPLFGEGVNGITRINIKDTVVDLVSGLVTGGGGFDPDSIVEKIAEAIFDMDASVYDEDVDGEVLTHYQIKFGEDLTRKISDLYFELFDTIVETVSADPDMGMFAMFLNMLKIEQIDESGLVGAFDKDGTMKQFKLYMKHIPSTQIPDKYNAFEVVVNFNGKLAVDKDGKTELDYELEAFEDILAMEKNTQGFRDEVAKLTADGMMWLDDSYGRRLDQLAAEYDAFDDIAQTFNAKIKKQLDGAKTAYTAARKGVSDFHANVAAMADASKIAEKIEETIVLYDGFSSLQREYVNADAVTAFLAIRDKYEKETKVPALIAEIDGLMTNSYDTLTKYLAAIDLAQSRYNSLLAANCPLVTNSAKLDEARADYNQKVLADLDARLAAATAKIGAVNSQTSDADLKKLDEHCIDLSDEVAGLSEEDAETLGNASAFKTDYEAFHAKLVDNYEKAVAAIAPDANHVAIGDETFNKIQIAAKLGNILPEAEMKALPCYRVFDNMSLAHTYLEVKATQVLIDTLGDVKFDDASLERLCAVRRSYLSIRKEYQPVINGAAISFPEHKYFKFAIGKISETVTLEDEAAIVYARAYYDKLVSDFKDTDALDSINTTCKRTLEKLAVAEQALAALKAPTVAA